MSAADSAGIQQLFHLIRHCRSAVSDGLIRREPSLGVQNRLPDGSMLDIMNKSRLIAAGSGTPGRRGLPRLGDRAWITQCEQRSTIGNQSLRRIRAGFAGAVAVWGLWLLLANTDVLGGETQEPKSRVPPGIAARLSPASRARLNRKARPAQDTDKSARDAAAAAGRPAPLPSDDWTYRPTVLVRRGTSQGSGTIIASVDRETLVLTAAHVVQGRDPIVVELHRFNLGVERKAQGR